MKILINTDSRVVGSETFYYRIKDDVNSSLQRLDDKISRIEIHLSDEDGEIFSTSNKRCLMEARLKGRKPIAVSHQDETLEWAIKGAIEKLISLIDSTIGKMNDKRRKDSSNSYL